MPNCRSTFTPIKNKKKRSMGCTCSECIEACVDGLPGIFAPGEAEKAAKLLGMSFKKFKKFLIKEYNTHDVFMWTPRKVGLDEDRKESDWGSPFQKGRCVFLDDKDRCKIHKAKPKECREAFCCSGVNKNMREEISKEWLDAGAPIGHHYG